MSDNLYEEALRYHRSGKPGKLEITPTKPLANQHDLSLAYSPGVAAPCKAIEKDPLAAAEYTTRGNLVAVVSNGTAVLGLGAIGALAGKPVMEGKAVLFKQFAGIDVFDIEVEERDPRKFIDTVARLEPTFGGINLEDIKAPECFIIEKGLKERMKIPVFHDDQHGTAVVASAAIVNGLRVVGKEIGDVKMVVSGAGAAAQACMDLLIDLGLKKENILVVDRAGVIHTGRIEDMDPYKARFAADTGARTLQEALVGADLFLGLSAGGLLKAEWLPAMAERPLILALANPVPEIMPDEAKAVRPDAIIATGRSDYPNQVNNVLCFPFLFRGALDVGATEINREMKMAAVHAIAELARAEPSDTVRQAYGGMKMQFGADYILPKPFDPRLMEIIPPAVARAAMESGVATRPLKDLKAYRQGLENRIFRTGMAMKPLFDKAQESPCRVVYAEGEEEKILHVAQQVVQHGIAQPVLIGRREVIEKRIAELALNIRPGVDFELVDPHHHPRYNEYCGLFYQRAQRRGYSPTEAAEYMRNRPTVLAATMVAAGDADAMLCGTVGRYSRHVAHIEEIIGIAEGVNRLTALNALVLPCGTLFMADTYLQEEPSAEDLVEITQLCAEEVRWFGVDPKVALLSHSNFGSHDNDSARKVRRALEMIRQRLPELEVEGEMHADLALSEALRMQRFPGSRLKGAANLLIMPNQDAANISFNLLKQLGGGIAIGPILLGAARSAHVVTSSITVRGLLNMTAVAAVRALTMRT
jgi:malate dehydrogenase (oxaloacetate-decarboxylating)(NADP+)